MTQVKPRSTESSLQTPITACVLRGCRCLIYKPTLSHNPVHRSHKSLVLSTADDNALMRSAVNVCENVRGSSMDPRLYVVTCVVATILLFASSSSAQPGDLPYVSNGNLTFRNRTFYLDGNPLRILGGSLHYFRVVPEYWWDRMRKMKACGLNSLTL